MEKKGLESLKKISPNIKTEDFILMIERYYITKFGSRDNAEKYFKENNKNPIDEFNKKFDQEVLKKISETILGSCSLSDLLSNISNLKNDATLDKGKLLMNLENIKSLKPILTNTLDLTESRIQVSLIPFLEEKLKLSLKKTREELGYTDKRPFDIWLSVFFEDKFENRGANNGRISLSEYVEILSAFMLSYDEESFGSVNPEELLNRFKNKSRIDRKELKKFTNNSYKLLKELLDDINERENLKLPESYRKMPYKIATFLKREVNLYIQN